MTIGVSLFLIAVGAILKYAVTAHVSGINLHTAGLIVMVIGILGLLLGVWLTASRHTTGPPPPPEPL
jgi:Domain of unknown function (DUF6458)